MAPKYAVDQGGGEPLIGLMSTGAKGVVLAPKLDGPSQSPTAAPGSSTLAVVAPRSTPPGKTLLNGFVFQRELLPMAVL